MRVFVLCTGRCGSETFARACRHITNFTSAHESQAGLLARDYPDGHIEVDNRLAYMLGTLEFRYGTAPLYVHLRRDPEAVARSYNGRWGMRESMVDAFAYGLVQRSTRWPVAERMKVCRAMVLAMTDNIEAFLRGKQRVNVDIENPEPGFREMWERIGAEGDLSAALAVFGERHNASAPRNAMLTRVVRWIRRQLH